MKPVRIQRKRTKGYKQPDNCKYCGRPTKWGNPFIVGQEMTRWQKAYIAILIGGTPKGIRMISRSGKLEKPINLLQSLEYYRMHVDLQISHGYLNLDELRNYDYLSCFCPLDQKCHIDVLIEML